MVKLLRLSAAERRRIMSGMKIEHAERRRIVKALREGLRVMWNVK